MGPLWDSVIPSFSKVGRQGTGSRHDLTGHKRLVQQLGLVERRSAAGETGRLLKMSFLYDHCPRGYPTGSSGKLGKERCRKAIYTSSFQSLQPVEVPAVSLTSALELALAGCESENERERGAVSKSARLSLRAVVVTLCALLVRSDLSPLTFFFSLYLRLRFRCKRRSPR